MYNANMLIQKNEIDQFFSNQLFSRVITKILRVASINAKFTGNSINLEWFNYSTKLLKIHTFSLFFPSLYDSLFYN